MPSLTRAHGSMALAAVTVCVGSTSAFAQTEDASAAPVEELEVVVTGEHPKLRKGRRDRTTPSTVIDRRALRSPGKTSAEVLTDAPGIQVARRGAGADLATATLRGASSAQTPVYLAGIRINDDLTGTADLSLVPTFMLHSAEVYRGGAPADADRFGLGGAVFFEPRLPRGTHAGGGVTVGSFGYDQEWIGAAIGDDHASALAAVGRESADNDYAFLDDRGTRFDGSDDRSVRRQNADFEAYSAWAIGRAKLGESRVTLLAHGLSREQGVTGLSVVPSEVARGRAQRTLFAVRADVPCDAPRGCMIEAQTSALLTRLGLTDPLRELGLGTTHQQVAAERIAQRIGVQTDVAEDVRLGGSIDQGFGHLRADRIGASGARARRSSTRLASHARFRVPPVLELTALGAVAWESTAGGPTAVDHVDGSFRGGALAELAPLTLFTNAGRYVRTPTLGELFGVSGSARGNPLLEAERGVNTDLGVRYRAAAGEVSFGTEVVGFARFASDLIAYRRTALGVATPFNVDSARVLGLEAVVSIDLWHHLRIDGVLTALDPRDTSEGTPPGRDLLPFVARLTAIPSATLYAERPLPGIALSHASVTGRLLHRSSRVADPAGLIVLDALSSLDLELMLGFADDRIAARGRIENLTDDRATDVVGYPLPGRSAFASVEVWW